MKCVEVGPGFTGSHWPIGPDQTWENVRQGLSDIERGPDSAVAGWKQYTALYSGTDEFDERRYYFVAETWGEE